jgi:hypothetical protein|tara:strand:+ start:19711 stop:19899 length:189 start_codon:yes stop_codon:yes gene_type:complete
MTLITGRLWISNLTQTDRYLEPDGLAQQSDGHCTLFRHWLAQQINTNLPRIGRWLPQQISTN